MSIGKRIKQLREGYLKLTQKDFAQKINSAQRSTTDWESGKSMPGASALKKIHEIFNVNIHWLLTGEGEPFVEEIIKNEPLLYIDPNTPAFEESQDAHISSETITKEEAEKRKREANINKERSISPEERLSDHEARLAALEENLKKPSVSTDLETRNRELETEIKQLKIMLREGGQDFKDLVNSLKEVIEKDTPPEPFGERRRCMTDIMNLLTGTQDKLDNSGSTNN